MTIRLNRSGQPKQGKSFGILGSIAIILPLLLVLGATPTQTASAQSCGLVVTIIAAPYSVVDSNKPGIEGPQSAMLGARIENTSGIPVEDVTVQFSSGGLSMLTNSPSSYFINDLGPSSSVTAYWPITYPATYGVGYGYNITASTPGGCAATDASTLTTRSQISASANNILPTGGSITVNPPVVSPGSLTTVRVTGFTLGTVGQGPDSTYDAWLQPIGNLDFDPSCVRLVRSEVKLNSINASPYVDQLYFTDLKSYRNNSSDYVEYTFIALKTCSTVIQPYQEAASGTQEKYNADYDAATNRISVTSSGSSNLLASITSDRNSVVAGDTVQYTISTSASGLPVGYPDNGNPVVLSSSVPAETTYVAGSATAPSSTELQFSIDGGVTWSAVEPNDPVNVTDLRWVMTTAVSSTPIEATYSVQIDSSYSGASVTAAVDGTLLDGSFLVSDSTISTGPAAPQLQWSTESTFVAYEDLKSSGWSDWDYNDFVVRIDIQLGQNDAGQLATLEIDYEGLARGAGYYHRFLHELPLQGGGISTLALYDSGGTLIKEVTSEFSTDTTFMIFENTRTALPPVAGLFDTNTRPSQPGIVDGQTAKLTITLNDPSVNPVSALSPAPWDPYIYVINTDQEVHLTIPGHLNNTQIVNADKDATSPMVGYDLPLAQSFTTDWQWPIEFAGVWRGYPQYANYIDSGKTNFTDWQLPENANPPWIWPVGASAASVRLFDEPQAPESRYFASPTTADVNGDGSTEIVIGDLLKNQMEVVTANHQLLPGWPKPVDGGIKAAAQIADLNGDGMDEILVGATDGRLYAWHHDGTVVTGWPVTLNEAFRVLATPAVVDIDADGVQDVIAPATDGRLYAFDAAGLVKSGWPVSIGNVEDLFGGQVINSSPQIADLDGDGATEIVIGSSDHRIYAFNADGSVKWTYQTDDLVLSTPAVSDVDPNVAGLETVVGSGDGYVYVLSSEGTLIWRRVTGWTVRSSPIVADMDGDQDLEIIIGSDDDKVWAWHHTGDLVNGWPQLTGADVFSSAQVGDVDGDGTPEVVIGSDSAYVYAWHADGSAVDSWPRRTNSSVKGAPALANLDDDAALEVVAGDLNGALFIWNGEKSSDDAQLFLPIVNASE